MKPKIMIYINSHVAYYTKKPILKKFLNKKIGHNKWFSFGDILIPDLIRDVPEYITDNFFHGISAHQYTMIQNGGTFVNPMLYGLHNDFNLWNNIIHEEPDFFKEVIYINVPYDMYTELCDDDEYKVNESIYNDMSKLIEDITVGIRKEYYTEMELH